MDDPPRNRWARYELPVNLAMLLASLVLLVIGLVLPSGLLTGAGMLAAAFFAVYSAYAYVRRQR